MARTLILGFAAALICAACVGDTEPAEQVTTTSNQTVVEHADEILVIATTDGRAVVVDRSGDPIASYEPGADVAVRQPVWMDRDTIVLAESGDAATGLAFISASSGDLRMRVAMDTPPFYYLPSPPQDKSFTTSLRDGPDGVGLVAELVSIDGSVSQLGDASPFYSSWSPDGQQLVLHTGQASLDLWRDGESERLVAPTGQFQAPAWTETGIVTLRTTAAGQLLSVFRGDVVEDMAVIEGPVQFVVSGAQIAIQSAEPSPASGGVQASLRLQALPTIAGRRLVVVDSHTGTIETVSTEPALLYQWSPSGGHLLYATFESGDTPMLQWHVWSESGTVDHQMFVPQPEWVANVVPFFDQYAQSISLWSASGEAFAFPAMEDQEPVVIVQPVDGSAPTLIENATWITWAPLS